MKHAIAIAALFSVLGFSAQADELVQVEINKGEMVRLSRPAASVVVADPQTADVQVVSPKLVFVHGKKIGETSLTAVDGNDETIFNGTIQVTHNLSSLKRAVKRVAPDADVNFKSVDGGLVMDGSAVSMQQSENIRNVASAFVGKDDKLVNMMTSAGGDQVALKVKIVEMSRTDLKDLGLNLQGAVSTGGIDVQILQGSDILLNGSGTPNRGGSSNTNLFGSLTSGRVNISGLIDALETQGLATVLAEPSLTSVSGKPASFLAGGQYPIPLRDAMGAITVSYQPFGVSLNFTPVVLSKDRLSILVAPEVSTLNFANPIEVAGFTYPILDTRRAQATVELGSGQTFALAGLLRNDTSNNITKLPGVGDIPLLGALFRSSRFQNNQTELVILVTPYIVHPVSDAKKIQTPLDGFSPPGDMERTLIGSLYEQEDMDRNKPAPAPSKPPVDDDDSLFEEVPQTPAAPQAKAEPKPQALPVVANSSGFILE